MTDIKGSVIDCLDHKLYFIRIPPTVFIKTLASIIAQQTQALLLLNKGGEVWALLGPSPEFQRSIWVSWKCLAERLHSGGKLKLLQCIKPWLNRLGQVALRVRLYGLESEEKMRWANGANFGPPTNSISWGATSCHVFVSTLVLSTVQPCLKSKLLGKAHGPFRPTSSLLAPVSLARCRVRNAELQRGEAQSHRSHHLEASPVMANGIWACGLVFLLAARSTPKPIRCTGWTVKSAESQDAFCMQWCQRNVHVIKILGIKRCTILSILNHWVRCKFKCL